MFAVLASHGPAVDVAIDPLPPTSPGPLIEPVCVLRCPQHHADGWRCFPLEDVLDLGNFGGFSFMLIATAT